VGFEGLGVVVLTHGRSGEHAPLVDSLLTAGVESASIVVVHNPTAPGEPLPEAPPGCRVVQAPRNLGYAGGMNLGIAEQLAAGPPELLLLMTHDARLRGAALETLVATARRHPGYGVLGPALVFSGTDAPFSFGGMTRVNGTNTHLVERPAGLEGGVGRCDWVDGGILLIRAAALGDGKPFDERFWGYCEEADFCLRVRRRGLAVGVVVDALAEQEPAGAKRPGVWSYLLTRNGAEYAKRAVGARGAVTVEARALGTVLFSLARALARVFRKREGGVGEPWAVAVGTARGALDYLRGRWGPPPGDLPGMGDVGNA
jgi:GT2 family glycosyltransferase